MTEVVFILLVLLFVKHFVVDFIFQTEAQVISKGKYLDWPGITHSLQHGLGTYLVFFIFVDPVTSLSVALIDFVIHYHVDWAKININNKFNLTPADRKFWILLGADQLLHSLTYIWLIWALS